EQLAQSRRCDFKTIVVGRPRDLVPTVRDEVYQICREALINAFQHAEATLIEVQLNYGLQIFAAHVRDDGMGIDPETLKAGKKAGHWGLIGMRERAREVGGYVEIWSGSRPGTEIQLQVPARIAYVDSGALRPSRWRRWLTAGARSSE
ncbi:MAG TPA: ATP-binding protein, partial [Rhodanobacteraceae bacterium]